MAGEDIEMTPDQDFRRSSAVSAAALTAAAALLIAACIAPCVMIGSLEKRMLPLIESAQNKTISGDISGALEDIEKISSVYHERSEMLMLVFHHSDLCDLEYAVDTSQKLAQAGDQSQLLAELTAIESTVKNLDRMHRPRLNNLF